MIRSMSTAVTGLRGHQQKLDVIGNNIANVNTVAFKKSQARFEDLFSQTIQGATAPDQRGGINPSQVGMGMRVSTIVDVHFQGSIMNTDRETDLAIEGNGFFLVSDGFRQFYTRDGSFSRDSNGDLVNANGMRLLGWAGTGATGEMTGINIPLGERMVARASTEIFFTGNLDARSYSEATAGRVDGTLGLTNADIAGMTQWVTLGVAVNGGSVQGIRVDMGAVNTQAGLRAAINAQLVGATATFDINNNLVVTSTATGAQSQIELIENGTESLFGDSPVMVPGLAATVGQAVGEQVIDDAYVVSLHGSGNRTFTVQEGAGPVQTVTIDFDDAGTRPTTASGLLGAINAQLGAGLVADYDGLGNLRVTGANPGAASVMTLGGADQAAFFGANPWLIPGNNATPGTVTGLALTDNAIAMMTDPLVLSFQVDGGAPQVISLDMALYNDRAGLAAGLSAALGGAGAAFDPGTGQLVVTSATTGAASSVVLHQDDDYPALFGVNPAYTTGTDTVIDRYTYEYYLYDSLGRRYSVDYTFTPLGGNVWNYTLTVSDPDNNLVPGVTGNSGQLRFTERGALAGNSITPDIVFNPPGAAQVRVSPDFDSITQLAGMNSLLVREQDGYAAGELVAFYISRTGVVVGTYTNGMVEELSQIAMAYFSNPEGLAKEGNNLYMETANSGEARIGPPGTESRGLIQSSALEMSNTDLAYEFTELITTSRAFQANTRVVTTSDEVLVEVINMKR